MSNFLGITAHFIDATWKLCGFVLAADSFLEKHIACNISKAYGDVIEKFKLTSKVTKVVSDNTFSMVKAFQILLLEFILHKTVDEVGENDNEVLVADSISEHDFVEGDADLNYLLSCLPERVSCFAHTQQLCIKDCLQDLEF